MIDWIVFLGGIGFVGLCMWIGIVGLDEPYNGKNRRLRKVRRYPGSQRKWMAEGAIYPDNVHARDWNAESKIVGWQETTDTICYPYWDGSSEIPYEFGFKSYDEYLHWYNGDISIYETEWFQKNRKELSDEMLKTDRYRKGLK